MDKGLGRAPVCPFEPGVVFDVIHTACQAAIPLAQISLRRARGLAIMHDVPAMLAVFIQGQQMHVCALEQM